MGSWCDRLGDFDQMQVHSFGVAGWQDQSRALSLLRADGSEDVGRGGALIRGSAGRVPRLADPAARCFFDRYAPRAPGTKSRSSANIGALSARLHPGALAKLFRNPRWLPRLAHDDGAGSSVR